MARKRIEKLATHSGKFHSDECMAVVIMQTVFDVMGIIRTRDPAQYSDADAVIDVGGVFDIDKLRFDLQVSSVTIKDISSICDDVELSSCGVVYGLFGQDAIAEILQIPLLHPAVLTVFEIVYFDLIRALCEKDNIASKWTDADKTRLSTSVQELNHVFRPPVDSHADQRFLEALELCRDALYIEVRDAFCQLPGTIFINPGLYNRDGILRECWPGNEPIRELSKTIALSEEIVAHEFITACIYLKTSKYADYQVLMTNDPNVRDQCDIVVSEISCTDSEMEWFMAKVGADSNDFVSAAGITCAKYVPGIIEKAILEIGPNSNPTEDEKRTILKNVYAEFFNRFDSSFRGEERKFWKDTRLVYRMSRLNNKMLWEPGFPNFGPWKAFETAMKEMMDVINSNVCSRLIHYRMILNAIRNRTQVHDSGRIIELEEGMKYDYILKEAEEQLNLKSQILFVIIPPDDMGYRVHCVRGKKKNGYRCLIKRFDISPELVPFVSETGVLAVGTTRDSVLQLAIRNVNEYVRHNSRPILPDLRALPKSNSLVSR